MSVASTAQLIVEIIGKDLLTPAVASAESGLTSMSGMSLTAAKSASTAEKALGLVGSAATGMGNALNHAKGFLGGLISGPLGLLGLGAGALTAAGAIKETIGTANDLAAAIEKLAPLTGDSAEQLSGLLAVFNKFGISTDTAVSRLTFMEKAVGNLTLTTASATKFQQEFGVSLVDASGHVKDANTLLALAADYWTGTASATQKAAFEAKLFGRGFADMIPILNLGSKGLQDAEAAAASLGLTLSGTNVKDLKAYQDAVRGAGEAIGGLKLQIALALIPTITELANSIRTFVTDHRTDLVSFFKSALASAKEIGGALLGVGKAAVGVWNSIPGPLRDLMIQALVGNKVIKTVFGINILGTVEGAVANIGKDLLSKLVGSIFSKNIATPVVNIEAGVVNAGGAGLPGAAGGAGAAAGGIGLGTVLGSAAAVAAAAVLIINANQGNNDLATKAAAGDPVAIRTQNEKATRGFQNPVAGNAASAAAPVVAAVGKTNTSLLNALAVLNRINLATAGVLAQERAHTNAIDKIKDIAGTNHDFLTLFRTGSAKAKIGLFPAEFNYLSTASAATKSTSTFVSGVRQDITALKAAEVTATGDQKKKLDADILALQTLVQATTAAVYSVKLSPAALTTLQNTKDQGSSLPVKVTVTHVANTAAASKAKQVGPVPKKV